MLVEDVAAVVRGNVQPGDVILGDHQARPVRPRRRARRRSTTLLAKLDKGASVTLQLKRGEQQFFATLRC